MIRMDYRNGAPAIIRVVLSSLLIGVVLLIGINFVLQSVMNSIGARLDQMEAAQKIGNGRIIHRLSAIQDQLEFVHGKLAELPSPPLPPEDFNKVYKIDMGASPINGKKEAPITIVFFSDLQCPVCVGDYQALKEILKAYPDHVKVVMKNYPLSYHPSARPAAKVALAADEQGKYFEMAGLLYQNKADVSEAKIKDYAKQLNLDYHKLMSDGKDKDAEYEKRIVEDVNLGDQVDVRGTPTVFINGKKTEAGDFDSYKAEIDKILSGNKLPANNCGACT